MRTLPSWRHHSSWPQNILCSIELLSSKSVVLAQTDMDTCMYTCVCMYVWTHVCIHVCILLHAINIGSIDLSKKKGREKDNFQSSFHFQIVLLRDLFLSQYNQIWKGLLLLLLLSRFSHVWLCAAPETAAHQAPLSLGFSRQEHWSGLPFPSPMQESGKWKWSRSVVSDSLRPHGL